MKHKHLIIFTLKKISRNIDTYFLLLIVLITGLCGLIVSSEFSNAVKEINSIIITVETNFNSEDDFTLENIICEIDKLDGISEINYDSNLYIKTTKRENINKISELLDKNNYDFSVRYINSDGSLSPKFSLLIEKLSEYMFVLLLIVTQIMFIIITLKKVNIESTDFAIFKCMGYKTKDILTIVSAQLLLISAVSFIISIILSVLIINVLNYYLQEYVNIKFHFNTITNQMIILIIEYFFVCLFAAIKIRKINVIAACSIF